MIPAGRLARVVVSNTLRSSRHFALSVFGIVVGIASFVFFLALSAGVQNVVLGKIFPSEEIEVVARRANLAGISWEKKLDSDTVAKIAARPEVAGVVPRMTVTFPASGRGYFEGRDIKFEVGGFCDGIAPEFVSDESFAALFQDWESEEHRVAQKPCGPAPTFACQDPERYYCDRRDFKCHHRVPVIVSETLREIYNGQFAESHGLPKIDVLSAFIATRGGLGKMRFRIGLGETMVPGSNEHIPESKRRTVEGVLVGISNRAMTIGMTVPIQYVERWNREFVGQSAAQSYSSLVVTLENKDDVAPFSTWVQDAEDGLNLGVKDSMSERLATAIFIVTTLFVLISFIIVTISAINIAHNFFMQVSERRREIGVLRAVGATRADVRYIILGEATFIGMVGGALGVLVAALAAAGVDLASARLLPDFPYKPETYFVFQLWIIAGGLAFATLFCVLGGFLPARRAALMEPAQALAQQ